MKHTRDNNNFSKRIKFDVICSFKIEQFKSLKTQSERYNIEMFNQPGSSYRVVFNFANFTVLSMEFLFKKSTWCSG